MMLIMRLYLIVYFLYIIPSTISSPSHALFRNFFNHAKECGSTADESLRRFVELRTGDNNGKPVFWHHSGVIRNPSNGIAICGVEGVEYIVPLPQQELLLNMSRQENNAVIRTAAETLFRTPALSYLTKKLFFHVNPHNPKELLSSFRVQRSAPARPVNAITALYEKVTYFKDPNHKLQCQIEFPSTRTLTSKKIHIVKDGHLEEESEKESENEKESKSETVATSSSSSDSTVSDKSSLSSRSSLNLPITAGPSERYHIGHVMVGGEAKTKINRWISFAAAATDFRGKSQEILSISCTAPPSHSFFSRLFTGGRGRHEKRKRILLDYVRFGEAPAWSVPGRPSVTELQGRCYPDYAALPTTIRSLLEQHQPAFLTDQEKDTIGQSQTHSQTNTAGLMESFHRQPDAFLLYKPWYHSLLPVLPAIFTTKAPPTK